jgi:hypothetical protein
VPSLKGVWYRGPFEHNGSVSTLEDWFDGRRLRDDYVPTGYRGYAVQTRAIKGHEFGLKLAADERAALIAFAEDSIGNPLAVIVPFLGSFGRMTGHFGERDERRRRRIAIVGGSEEHPQSGCIFRRFRKLLHKRPDSGPSGTKSKLTRSRTSDRH